MQILKSSLLVAALLTAIQPVAADDAGEGEPVKEVVVIAPYAAGLDPSLVPANVQRANAETIRKSQSLDLSDFLNRNLGSVSVNHAQNNPLQPDLNFRGFTASPLLGLSPGLTVYQSGVRINEPFGDTVNWDLIPLSAIDSLQLMAGTNPVFGLNTLGGALSIEMKNGFTFEGTQAEIYGGSFSRREGSVQHGVNNGRWGAYGNLNYFEEDGWRDFSKSDAVRFAGAISLRAGSSKLDANLAYASTKLRGNGSAPAELLALDRSQVFTHPDITENRLAQVIVVGTQKVSDGLDLAGNVFYRDIDTDTFNGDGTIFEECEVAGEELLAQECAGDDTEVVRDQNGQPIAAELEDEELNAINNVGGRRQKSYGASGQVHLHADIGQHLNELLIGMALSQGDTGFNSAVEVAHLLGNRSTSRTGIFADEFRTDLDSEVRSLSVYFADTLKLSARTAVTLSGRYDDTRVQLADRSDQTPELNGRHDFSRFNPAIGMTFQVAKGTTLYGSYGQTARAPTPVELACASEDAPCNLPNAFLADPPLDQVVARSFELGIRGEGSSSLRWRLGAFRTSNEDDILFQTTGGTQANVGFFDNVGDTQRAGIELGLSQRMAHLTWSMQYSYIDATFEDAFIVNSPNHPVFEDDLESDAIAGDGKLQVHSGSSIPGIPRHQANVGIDYAVTDRLRLGGDVEMRSGVRLRGDEANLLARTDSYAILNLRGDLRASERLTFFLKIENALDQDYETFGLLGEPDEVFENFEDPRFLGAGPPFGAWLGFRLDL